MTSDAKVKRHGCLGKETMRAGGEGEGRWYCNHFRQRECAVTLALSSRDKVKMQRKADQARTK